MPHRYDDPGHALQRAANSHLIGEITRFEFHWDESEEAYFWTLEGGEAPARSRLISEPGASSLEVEFTTSGYVQLPYHFHNSEETVRMIEGQCTIEVFEQVSEYEIRRVPHHLHEGDTHVVPVGVWHAAIYWVESLSRISWVPPHPVSLHGGPRDGFVTAE